MCISIQEESKANKGKVVEDPFTRRHTKPNVLHRKFVNNAGEGSSSPVIGIEPVKTESVATKDEIDSKNGILRALPSLPAAVRQDFFIFG